jgi:nicotinamide riboside transporter PnuC
MFISTTTFVVVVAVIELIATTVGRLSLSLLRPSSSPSRKFGLVNVNHFVQIYGKPDSRAQIFN